ncbi:MAG: sugar ABC transporter permease [Clostridia bacterium]|nr:sugar ABC transporter permease [Clostridia bacterium]
MFLPGMILTFLFSYLPMFGIIIAFKKVNLRDGILSSPWIGFKNFEMVLKNSNAWISIRNTVAYNAVFIITGLIFSVALAIALSILKNKLSSKVYQTIYIMPHFLSMVIVAYLVFAFLNMESGFINKSVLPIIFGEGAQKINWYAESGMWPYILFIVRTWKTVGYGSIVYLAAIAGIDMGMYEAAKIDGANLWQQILNITLPSLKTIMTIMTIMNVGHIFSADFGLFYNVPMNSGALYPTTLVINTYVYNVMTAAGTASTGMASAAAMLQSVLGFVLVIVTNAIVRKVDESSALF